MTKFKEVGGKPTLFFESIVKDNNKENLDLNLKNLREFVCYENNKELKFKPKSLDEYEKQMVEIWEWRSEFLQIMSDKIMDEGLDEAYENINLGKIAKKWKTKRDFYNDEESFIAIIK